MQSAGNDVLDSIKLKANGAQALVRNNNTYGAQPKRVNMINELQKEAAIRNQQQMQKQQQYLSLG